MKLTLEVYSTSAGDAGGAPSFGVRIRDRRALEAGALYDPLDVNFLVDREFLPAPETVAVSIYRPSESEDGGSALVATTAGSAFAPVPGHSMMHRGVLATATQGFDSWYEETRCPDGDHTYPVPVFSILEVRWSCGAEDCMARAGAVPAILTPIGVRAVKGLDGTDGEDGKAPEVDVVARGDGTYRMTVTSPDGTSQTVEWRDGRDGDGAVFPAPVSPDDATAQDQYAGALAVQGLLAILRKDLSGVESRLDVLDSLTNVEKLDSILSSLPNKVDKVDGYGLVLTGASTALEGFIGTYGGFGGLAGLDEVTFNELGTDLVDRFRALESAVESLPPSGDGGMLNAGYVKFLDTVVASGGDSAQRILDAVDLVLAESNDAGKGVWKAVNANAKGLAELEAKVGSGGSSPIPAELEAMIRNSVQKDALGRGFSSNDFTQDYIDRINNSVQKVAGKGLSTVDFTMERAERLDALFNSSPTLNPPVKPDENAKKGQPADAKDTYEALKGLSFTKAPDSHGSEWQAELAGTLDGAWTFITQPSLEWRTSAVTGYSGWYVTPFTVKLSSSDVPVPDSALEGAYLLPGTYSSEQTSLVGSSDRNLDDVVCACYITGVGTTAGESVRISIQVRFHRELYVYKDDPYVTKTYVDNRIADEIGKIEIPEPDVDVTLPNDISCATLHAANSVTVGSRSSTDTPGQSSFSSGRGNIASGDHSHAEGDSVIAKGLNSHAEGCTTEAKGNCSHAEGKFTVASGAYSHAAGFRAKAQQHAYAWSGVESDEVYESNGDGTYNINPAGGIKGFYVGDKNLKTILSEEAPVPDLSGKRDRTDNIAAADEVGNVSRNWVCSPSRVVYDGKEWELSVKWISENPEDPELIGWAICFDGEPRYGYSVFKDREATTLTWRESDDWTGYETITATASGELLVEFYTKSGEPYVTPAGVKALAVPGFNQLAPETSDTTVTFKPANGKANWVEGTVNGMNPKVEVSKLTFCGFDLHHVNNMTGEDKQIIHVPDFVIPQDAYTYRIGEYDPAGFTVVFIYTDSDIQLTNDVILRPTSFELWVLGEELHQADVGKSLPADVAGFYDVVDNLYSDTLIDRDFISVEGSGGAYVEVSRASRAMSVQVPQGVDSARTFTLTITSDASSSVDVEWEGATEIIEAFPGASKFAVGTTVWDVKEVAPGKMLVNRTPGASGGSVTLTSESGSNYELTVNNDGELEVKES